MSRSFEINHCQSALTHIPIERKQISGKNNWHERNVNEVCHFVANLRFTPPSVPTKGASPNQPIMESFCKGDGEAGGSSRCFHRSDSLPFHRVWRSYVQNFKTPTSDGSRSFVRIYFRLLRSCCRTTIVRTSVGRASSMSVVPPLHRLRFHTTST